MSAKLPTDRTYIIPGQLVERPWYRYFRDLDSYQVKLQFGININTQNIENIFATMKQVFIGAPDPLPNYPALIFTQTTIDGQDVYAMQVTDGTP